MKRRTAWWLGGTAAALLGVAAVCGWLGVKRLMYDPVVEAESWVYIHDGQVEDPGNALQAATLQWALSYYGFDDKVQQGRLDGAYRLQAGAAALPVARQLTRHQQTPVRIAFNNIRLKEQWAGRVAPRLLCDSAALVEAMTDPAFLAEAGVDEANVIGLLLPDTYELYWNTSAPDVMRRMLREYRTFWNDERTARATELGLTPREVTVLCSIAEEETNNARERGIVARLYWNRLQRGMLLQADPTVKFALGDFGLKRILLSHLTVDSPYNTYRYAGLPPGPLRMVEKATIDALLNSEPHDYLYMCAKPELNGLHNFARTLAEHQRNADAYHRAIIGRTN